VEGLFFDLWFVEIFYYHSRYHVRSSLHQIRTNQEKFNQNLS